MPDLGEMKVDLNHMLNTLSIEKFLCPVNLRVNVSGSEAAKLCQPSVCDDLQKPVIRAPTFQLLSIAVVVDMHNAPSAPQPMLRANTDIRASRGKV